MIVARSWLSVWSIKLPTLYNFEIEATSNFQSLIFWKLLIFEFLAFNQIFCLLLMFYTPRKQNLGLTTEFDANRMIWMWWPNVLVVTTQFSLRKPKFGCRSQITQASKNFCYHNENIWLLQANYTIFIKFGCQPQICFLGV